MKHRFKTAAAVIAALCGFVYAQGQWQNLYPSYTGLAFGGGNFVAVSADGLIKTGSGQGSWSQHFRPDSRGLLSAAYGDGTFIVTHRGIGSQGSVFLSNDGLDWNPHSISSNIPCVSIASGEGNFAGVGEITSFFYENGNFEDYTMANYADYLSHIAFGAGRFVAVGSDILSTTPAQITSGLWNSAPINTSSGVNVVAFGGGKFVAIATGGSTVYTSDNGTSWTSSPSNAPAGMLDMTFGGGKFVAVGSRGSGGVSTDGLSWTPATGLNANDNFRAVKYDGSGRFLALGAYGSVYSSTDGVSWTKQTDGRNMTYRHIVFGGSMFVAVGDSGISTSADGIDWVRRNVEGKNFRSVTFGGGKFVAVGDSGAIFSSTDGVSWEDHTRSDGTMFHAVAFGGGTFIAGGMTRPMVGTLGGTGIYTWDGAGQWMDQSQHVSSWPTNVFPTAIAFGGDRFIAGASNGSIFSTTGTESYGRYWSVVASSDVTGSQRIATVTYSGDRFTALGTTSGSTPSATAVIWSANGSSGSWTPTSAPPRASVRAATFAKGSFVLAADSGNIFASPDGSNWGLMEKTTNKNLTTIYIGNDKLLAAGANGAMLFSSETPVSIRNTRQASNNGSPRRSAGMTISRAGRTPTVTLSFTPERDGTIAVYSLTGRQLYKRNVGARERVIQLPGRLVSNGSVIVSYTGGDGKAVSQRFNMVK